MHKQVLLVDDNLNDLELALEALGEAEAAPCVTVAQGGVQALAYLHAQRQQSAEPLSLVLLDLKMPQMDGLAVLEAIRQDETLQDIPVVMLTTSRDVSDIRACYRRGANGYVVKPLDFTSFTETLRDTLAFWLGKNEIPGPRVA
ncbi:response regulator [Deinococcus sonorensis]|uniref:Response regulator n=2 Tax=Deinococcus sonorensis TaxID=309891 RepID=A0AAU7UD25_9DEIO